MNNMALGKNRKRHEEKVHVIISTQEFNEFVKKVNSHYNIKYFLPMIDSVVVEIKKETSNKLFGCNYIVGKEPMVEMDSIIHAEMNRASHIVQTDSARDENLYGQGVGVAVMDTGVYPHSDLITGKNRIIAFYDVVNGRRYPYDDNGHGTHV